MNKMIFSIVLILVLFINHKTFYATSDPINEDTVQYQTLDELKKNLKDERKKIDQQRLEELRLREEEKRIKEEELNEKSSKNNTQDFKKEIINDKKGGEYTKQGESIPKLIVRLRGKHTKKYLCSYKFTIDNSNAESVLENNFINDYKELLNKPSLKVRVNEVINFEFLEQPKKLKVFIWNETTKELPVKRGSIRVPDNDGKIVVGIDGEYETGTIRYAIVLDIRR